jgi:hypothetical protein
MYVGGRMGFIENAIALGRGIIVITMMEVTAIVLGVIAASGIGDRAVTSRWPPA